MLPPSSLQYGSLSSYLSDPRSTFGRLVAAVTETESLEILIAFKLQRSFLDIAVTYSVCTGIEHTPNDRHKVLFTYSCAIGNAAMLHPCHKRFSNKRRKYPSVCVFSQLADVDLWIPSN